MWSGVTEWYGFKVRGEQRVRVRDRCRAASTILLIGCRRDLRPSLLSVPTGRLCVMSENAPSADESGVVGRELSQVPVDYPVLLASIKERIRLARARAIMAVNAELNALYWEVGALIADRQQRDGWGAGVIPRLARDLRNEFPEEKGLSAQHRSDARLLPRVPLPRDFATACRENGRGPDDSRDFATACG